MDNRLKTMLTNDELTKLSLVALKGKDLINDFWAKWMASRGGLLHPKNLSLLVETKQIQPSLFWYIVFGGKLCSQLIQAHRHPMETSSNRSRRICKKDSHSYRLGDMVDNGDEIQFVGFSEPTWYRGYYTLAINSIERWHHLDIKVFRILLPLNNDCDVIDINRITMVEEDDNFMLRWSSKFAHTATGIKEQS